MFDAVRQGDLWPDKVQADTACLLAQPGAEGLDVVLVVALKRPTRDELRTLAIEPLWIGLMPARPVVWLIAAGQRIGLDTPCALGAPGLRDAQALRQCASRARSWAADRTGLLPIAVIDGGDDNRLRVHRRVCLSRAWWCVLADAFERCPDVVSTDALHRAAAQTRKRYGDSAEMLRDCAIVEHTATPQRPSPLDLEG